MSISKLRSKSAALGRNEKRPQNAKSTVVAAPPTASTAATTPTAAQHANQVAKFSYAPPPTSLLKIEPFVPRLSTKLRRPIHRSYSTLSSANVKGLQQTQQKSKLPACPTEGVLSHVSHRQLHKRQNHFKTINRQRSKSSCSSGTGNSPYPGPAAAAVQVSQQPNGVCRITRSQKDQEKLPDRINYDRRGLTAIPIFENEPNLRLLSLQHNLINVFHIRKDPESATTSSSSDEVNGSSTKQPPPPPPPVPVQGNNKSEATIFKGKVMNHHPSFSLQPSSPGMKAGPNNKLVVRNATVVLHTSQMPQQPSLGSLKRSKSFVSNYSKQLNSIKRNLQERAKADCVHSGFFPLNSFDCGASSTSSTSVLTPTSEAVDELQLNVKNNQLIPVYGQVFHNLVFLDLYDNQIERISTIDGLPSLSVLLLGKNRISDITGLAALRSTLRVLDLHGNKLTNIGNKISCLQELKSLNLAGNQIRQINSNDFCGLMNLKELNLKRNRIRRVNGFQHLVGLERLWLCHNDLHRIDDMSSIAKAVNLLEVTIENNPVSLAGDCVSFLVSYLPSLQTLSQMPITEQVRRAAMGWRKNKELSDANYTNLSSEVFSNIRREEVISNARTNWELLRSQQHTMSALSGRAHRVTTMSPKSSDLSKLSETLDEYIKLPPIQPSNPNETDNLNRSTSSTSSLGPNVDSSSSCFSSDNEDVVVAPRKQTEQTAVTTAKHPVTLTLFATEGVFGAASQHPHHYFCNKQNHQIADVKVANSASDHIKHEKSQSSSTASLHENNDVAGGGDCGRSNENGNISGSEEAAAAVAADNGDASVTNPSLGLPEKSFPFRGQQQQRSTSVTPSLGINGNGSTTIPTTNPPPPPHPFVNGNGNAKQRSMLGSLTRSQTMAKANQRTSGAHLSHSQLQHSHHHNSTATNGTNAAATGSASGTIAAAATGTATSSSTYAVATVITANKTSTTATTSTTSTASTVIAPTAAGKQPVEREREQGGDYLIEICGRYLNVYGMGALRFIDKQWNSAKANDVHTLNFSYINFNNIAAVLGRIKARFPHAEHFVFRETNITCLGQLNAFAELQGISSLSIDPDGNAITTKDLWRLYAIYRLSHWGLRTVNGSEVDSAEIDAAHTVYAGLSDLVLWSMPEAMLQPLLARLRLDETCTASKLTAKEWLMRADQSLRIVVGKEALQWKKTTLISAAHHHNHHHHHHHSSHHFEDVSPGRRVMRERGRQHFAMMIENTCDAVEKLNKLESLWPSLLLEIVRNTLLDYSQMDDYLTELMRDVMRDP